MKIITVAVEKGGVGKTTTATTLASGLARRGYRVLIVDTDAQTHAGTMLGVKNENHLFINLGLDMDEDGNRIPDMDPSPTGRTGLHILTGGSKSAWIGMMAPARLHISALREAILAAGSYDYVVIDTPPTMGWIVDAALYAADVVVAPVQLTLLSAGSGERFAQYVESFRTYQKLAPVEIIFLPTFEEETKVSAITLAGLRSIHNGSVSTPIKRAAVVEKIARTQTTLHEYAPENRHDAGTLGRAVAQYDDLISRIDA